MSDTNTSPISPSSLWPDLEKLKKKVETYTSSLSNQNLPGDFSDSIDEDWKPENGITFKATAQAGITILNSEKDEDSVEVWSNKKDKDLPPPLIPADSDTPYLKYSIETGASLEVSDDDMLDLPISVEGQGKLNLGFHTYLGHAKSDLLYEAVSHDIAKLAIPLSVSSIRSLDEGNAMAMLWSGGLSMKASVNWSDIIAPTVASLPILHDRAGILDIKIGPELKTAIDFSIQDTYKIVFYKPKGNRGGIIVEIKKQDGREIGLGASAGIYITSSLSGKAKETLQKLSEKIATQIIDSSEEVFVKIKKWVASADELPDELQEIANNASKKILGVSLDELGGGESKLKAKLEEWLKDIRSKAEETAKRQISLGASFSYRRISSEETLVRTEFTQVQLDAAKFAEIHKELRKGKSSLLQEHARTVSDSDYSFFLNSIVEKSVLKFSLGISIGDLAWFNKLTTKKEVFWSRNLDSFQRPSFTINTDRLVGSNKENKSVMIGSSALGKEFQDPELLTMDNLDFSISLNHTNFDSKVKEHEFLEYVDTARIWGAVPSSQESLDEAKIKIQSKLNGGAKLKFNCVLNLTDLGVSKLLAIPSAEDERFFGEAIALSLFTYKWEPRLIDLDLRIQGYAEACSYAYSAADRSSSNIATTVSIARGNLKEIDLEWVAQKELEAKFAAGNRQVSAQRIRIGGKPRSLTFLKNDLISCLSHRNHDTIVDLKEVIKFAKITQNDEYAKYDSPGEYQSKVMSALLVMNKLRDNKALFRSLGAYLSLRTAHMSRENRLKYLETSLHITEFGSGGTETNVLAFSS
ncbi:hypothetical protein MLD52_19545 [Puniceicoccaceae bacterium K14]|nr:hypothetical protein [Puniceicoccaceae bacterium K14]